TLTIELYESTIRYSGEFYDAEVGLYYLRARYYDPYVGRFISEDTYKGRANEPLSLNRYTYVLNNPLIYIDPTGHVETSLRELAGATGSTIVYDAQTKKTTVTLVDGYSIVFDPNKKDDSGKSVVTIKNGRTMIDNETFDKMMTGSKPVKDGTYIVQVDSTVVSAVKDKSGKVLEVAKVAVVTVVGKQSNEYTTGANKMPVLEIKMIRNSTIIYDPDTKKVLDTTSVFSLPADLTPKRTGFNSYSEIALAWYMMRDGSLSKEESKQLNLKWDARSSVELQFKSNKLGMSLGEVSQIYNQQVAVDLTVLIGIPGIKIGSNISAKMTVVNKGKGKTTTGTKTPAGGCNCFTAGTKVLTDEGEKKIEDIEVGDMVLAKDENNPNGELAYKEVTALYRNQRNDIIKLHVGEQIIETTDNHPFWVEGEGWVLADELEAGDKLQKADGSTLTIDKVEFVELDNTVTVYNFTVADYHTYYVTDLGVWVHNTSCFYINQATSGYSTSKHLPSKGDWRPVGMSWGQFKKENQLSVKENFRRDDGYISYNVYDKDGNYVGRFDKGQRDSYKSKNIHPDHIHIENAEGNIHWWFNDK
ncbi:polymorphic toxin-type HINT domain-containing protein, partial [Paenibacillus algorifonticola]